MTKRHQRGILIPGGSSCANRGDCTWLGVHDVESLETLEAMEGPQAPPARLMEEWGLERFAVDVSGGWSGVPDAVREALASLGSIRSTIRERRPEDFGSLHPMLRSRFGARERSLQSASASPVP